MGMKGVQGLTLSMGDEPEKSRLLQALTPERVNSIGYKSNFIRNCNLMLYIVIAVITIAFILYLLTYLFKSAAPSLYSFSKRILK